MLIRRRCTNRRRTSQQQKLLPFLPLLLQAKEVAPLLSSVISTQPLVGRQEGDLEFFRLEAPISCRSSQILFIS
jgi:hypothetical protein